MRLCRQHDEFLRLTVIARHDRDAGLLHQPLGRIFHAHRADRMRGRADEDKARCRHLIDEIRVFGEEAIAGMNRLSAALPRGVDYPRAHEIAFPDRRSTDMDGLVGHRHMHRIAICIGIDRHGRDPHAPCRLDDPAGDLAAIGDQDFLEHGPSRGMKRQSTGFSAYILATGRRHLIGCPVAARDDRR